MQRVIKPRNKQELGAGINQFWATVDTCNCQEGRDERIFWSYAKNRSCSGGVTTLDGAVVSNRATHNHIVRQRSRLTRLGHG